MRIREAAATASATLTDVRDGLADRTKLIVGLLGTLCALAAGILIAVLARR